MGLGKGALKMLREALLERELAVPVTPGRFQKQYRQHNDLRPGALERIRQIQEEGFKPAGFGPNALPPYMGGEPLSMTDKLYGPKKGRPLYLVPRANVRETFNGSIIRPGWKPREFEVIVPEEDYISTFDEYLKALENYLNK